MTLDELNDETRKKNFTAGWNKTTPSLWKEPITLYRPKLWRYAFAKQALHQAGNLISTELAERRNLLLFDDADSNQYATTRTLVAAYQMLKPKEHARAHRHSPNALRLVLEAPDDVATVVDGVLLSMRPGSVLLTPGGTWHSHFSHGTMEAYWIDVLDVPLVHQLEPMFFEPHPQEFQEAKHRPATHDYLNDAEAIQRLVAAALPEADGARVCDLSSDAVPTLAIQVIELGATGTRLVQEVANGVFAVMAGSGEVETTGLTTSLEFGDVLSVPMWHRANFKSKTGVRLLHVSDRPVMNMLGFNRSGFA